MLKHIADHAQTGVSDIPLTENGEKMVKEMGPRMMGPGSEWETAAKSRSGVRELGRFSSGLRRRLLGSMIPHRGRVAYLSELIDPAAVRHVFISPRKRAQRTAELVSGPVHTATLCPHLDSPPSPSLTTPFRPLLGLRSLIIPYSFTSLRLAHSDLTPNSSSAPTPSPNAT
jgi:hypothetical protein